MHGWGWVAWVFWVVLGCSQPVAATPPAASRQVVLLHTSDLHSRVWPFRERVSSFEAGLGLGPAGSLSEVGGFARLGFVVAQQRERGAALWLDSGDALEGAEVFQRFGGRLELEWLGRLGLSAMALGNHELSLSGSALVDALESTTFPVLAANLLPLAGSALGGRLAPSALFDVDGLKLGVVGVANPTSPPGLARPSNEWGLEVTVETALAVQVAVDELRSRADLVVVLSHGGLDRDRELIAATSGVDLVLGGHQHVVTTEPEWVEACAFPVARARACSPARVPLVHSGAYGKLVSRLELSLARTALDGWLVRDVALTLLPLGEATPERSDVREQLEPLRAPVQAPLAFLPEALSRRSALGGDSTLGNFTADAMLAASGADAVLLNSSGLRADLEPGALLGSELVLAFPFGEPWLLLWASGRELGRGLERAARRSVARGCESTLQVAGLRLSIDCRACERTEACTRVARITPWGELPLGPGELVALCLPAYLTQPGADFEGLGGGGATELGTSVVTALAQHMARAPGAAGARECIATLRSLSPERCRAAFGEMACPLDAAHARAACQGLPRVVGGRDGRVRMLP